MDDPTDISNDPPRGKASTQREIPGTTTVMHHRTYQYWHQLGEWLESDIQTHYFKRKKPDYSVLTPR
jgi:hypothetical protein